MKTAAGGAPFEELNHGVPGGCTWARASLCMEVRLSVEGLLCTSWGILGSGDGKGCTAVSFLYPSD